MPLVFMLHRCVCGLNAGISCNHAQLLAYQSAETEVGKKIHSLIGLGCSKEKSFLRIRFKILRLNLKKNDVVLDPCIENS